MESFYIVPQSILDSLIHSCRSGYEDSSIAIENYLPLLQECDIRCLLEESIDSKNVAAVKLILSHMPFCDANIDCLMHATRSGVYDIFKLVIAKYSNASSTSLGFSLLYSCANGHLNIVREILSRGVDLDFSSSVLSACGQGHEDILNELIAAGADLSDTDDFFSNPLCTAASKGHQHIVDRLLEAGFPLHGDDEELLAAAAGGGCIPLLSRLLSTAPSTSTLTRALASAAQTGQCASLGLIVPALAADAAPALTHALSLALHDGHRDAVSLLLAAKADVGGVDLFDRPMLLGAVKGGFADIVRDLLASGVDPNQTANLSHTPLVSASDPATVRVLLDAKADVGVPHVLRGAVDALQPEAVRMLLEAKADANCSTRISAETPLSRVLGPSIDCRDQDRVKRKLQVMELLLDAGAEYRNIGGSCSAAHICAGTLHDPSGVTAAEALVRRDPTVLQCVNGAGHTPMETAVLSLNAELVEVFIKHGADVNATCSANTPMLFTVCRAFRSEGSSARRVLRLLLAAGADPRACGGRNTTVLMELVRMKPAVPELTVRACLYDVIESVLRGPAQAQQGCESRVP